MGPLQTSNFSIGIVVGADVEGLGQLLRQIDAPDDVPRLICVFDADRFLGRVRDTISKLNLDGITVRMIPSPGANLAECRQLLLDACSTPYLIFVDSDCRLPRPWFTQILAAHHEVAHRFPEAPGWGAPAKLMPQGVAAPACLWLAQFFPGHNEQLFPATVEHLPHSQIVLHVPRIQMLGGYDPRFRFSGEDFDLSMRVVAAGNHWILWPNPCVRHEQNSRLGPFLHRMARYGYAQGQILWKHGWRSCSRRWVAPLSVATMAGPVLWGLQKWHELLALPAAVGLVLLAFGVPVAATRTWLLIGLGAVTYAIAWPAGAIAASVNWLTSRRLGPPAGVHRCPDLQQFPVEPKSLG